MAHAAELDENNKVIRVLVFSNDLEPNVEQFATNLFGGRWVQTSYNANFRGKYAAIGDFFDETENIFIEPQPFPSWIKNGSYWEPPITRPQGNYVWDETILNWVLDEN